MRRFNELVDKLAEWDAELTPQTAALAAKALVRDIEELEERVKRLEDVIEESDRYKY